MAHQIDWNAIAEKAQTLTMDELGSAIADANMAAKAADEMFRAGSLAAGAKDSGFYRDEISVYRKEFAGRDARNVAAMKIRKAAKELEAALEEALQVVDFSATNADLHPSPWTSSWMQKVNEFHYLAGCVEFSDDEIER